MSLSLKTLAILLLFLASNLFAQKDNLLTQGKKELDRGNYESAIEILTKLIESGKSNSFAYSYRGTAYLYVMMLDEAFADLNQAIKLDSTSADNYNIRGLICYYNGQYDLAETDFTKALSIDTAYAEAFVNRGTVFLETLKFDKAMIDLNKAIQIDKNQLQALVERGRLFYRKKEYLKAIDDYNSAILINPNIGKVYYNRGNAFYKLENYPKAIDDYTKALDIDSMDTESRNNRAMAYEITGSKLLAEEDRKFLGKIAGNEKKYIPIDSIAFYDSSDSLNAFKFKLPSNWFVAESHESNSHSLVLAINKISAIGDYYETGAYISLVNNMKEAYGVSTPDSLLLFWKGSMMKNAESWASYQVLSNKVGSKGKYRYELNKTLVQFGKNEPTFQFYEYVLVTNDVLMFCYFKSTEKEFPYYSLIFDKIIESLTINEKN